MVRGWLADDVAEVRRNPRGAWQRESQVCDLAGVVEQAGKVGQAGNPGDRKNRCEVKAGRQVDK